MQLKLNERLLTKGLANKYIVLLLCMLLSNYSVAADLKRTQPDPSLNAREVVEIVMNALANNDYPYQNHGIEITYNFASPENKIITGPLSRFSEMIRLGIYSTMLNSKDIKYENYEVEGGNAQLDVILQTRDNRTQGFQFRLKRQIDNEFHDCWMTDSVMLISLTTT
jgi:hypothetical protein